MQCLHLDAGQLRRMGFEKTIGSELPLGISGVSQASSRQRVLKTIGWVLMSVGLLAATGLYLILATMREEARKEAVYTALMWDARTAYLNHRLSRGEIIHENWYNQRIYGGICGIQEHDSNSEDCPALDLLSGSQSNDRRIGGRRCTPVLIRGDLDEDAGAKLYSIVDLQNTHRLLREGPASGNFSSRSVGLTPPRVNGKNSYFDYTIEPSGMCGEVFVYSLIR